MPDLTRKPAYPSWAADRMRSSSLRPSESSRLTRTPDRPLAVFSCHLSFRSIKSAHLISFPTATKTCDPDWAIVRDGPGLDFDLEEKGEILGSSVEGAKRLWPGAGLESQAGVKLFILGIVGEGSAVY